MSQKRGLFPAVLAIPDPQGVQTVIRKVPDAIVIGIIPDCIEDLSARVSGRGTGVRDTLCRASVVQKEIHAQRYYRHVVVNRKGHLEAATEETRSLILNYLLYPT